MVAQVDLTLVDVQWVTLSPCGSMLQDSDVMTADLTMDYGIGFDVEGDAEALALAITDEANAFSRAFGVAVLTRNVSVTNVLPSQPQVLTTQAALAMMSASPPFGAVSFFVLSGRMFVADG